MVTKAYGLYHRMGMDALNIAHPATLVIDRDRMVRYIYRGDNQHDRAPFDEVLEAVKKLDSEALRLSIVDNGAQADFAGNSGGGMKKILGVLGVYCWRSRLWAQTRLCPRARR